MATTDEKPRDRSQAAPGFGVESMFEPLARVLVKRPEECFAVDDPAAWHYAGRPDLAAARREHDALVEILRGAGAEVVDHPEPQPGRADAIFVFDTALMTAAGAVVLRPGKALRQGEEQAMARRLGELGVPILATLDGEARAEGGDLLWLDRRTLAVGQSFRTNREGSASSGSRSPRSASLPCRSSCRTGPARRPVSISCRS